MKTKMVDFEVLIPSLDGTEIADRVKVPVKVEWDEEVKEWLMTAEAHELIDSTKARLIGLLTPAQLKELRERYDYSQKEMGELFQVGEKSWTRWESGKHRPSRSINLLIRALYEGEVSINYLLKRAGKPEREEAGTKVWELFFKHWHGPQFKTQDLSSLLGKIEVVYSTRVPGSCDFFQKMVGIMENKPFPDNKAIFLSDRYGGSIPRLEGSRMSLEIAGEASEA